MESTGIWTLNETEKYCKEKYSTGAHKESLVDCQTHCVINGARILTFYPVRHYDNCHCCELFDLVEDQNSLGAQIYTISGK